MRYLKKYTVLILLHFFIYSCNNTIPQTVNQETAVSEKLSREEENVTSVKLLFVGDVMGHDTQIKSALNTETGEYNYSNCFKYLEPIVAKADIAVANLEVTLPGVPPYAGYPHFRSPDALAKGLKDAGFDLIVTANNHSNDAGKIGLDHTLDVLDQQKLLTTGTFRNNKERASKYPLIVEKNGFKIAFLNCTYGTNGMPDIPPTIVNRIDSLQLETDIKKAKEKEADLIIVLIHWGKEYKLLPNQEQIKIANWLASKDVNAIIGSHPHVIQPVETKKVKGATSSRTLITYSLGNFISNQRKADTEGGLLVEVEFKKNRAERKITIEDSSYSLLWRYIHPNKSSPNGKNYYTIPITPFESNAEEKMGMNRKEKDKMIAFASKFRKHLKKNGNVNEKKYKYEELFNSSFSKPL